MIFVQFQKKLYPILYADDSSFLISGQDPDTIINHANTDLAAIMAWLNANKLTLNVNKSNDEHLKWDKHICAISKKISKNIGILQKLRPVVHQRTLIKLYYSFIHSYLTNGLTS